MLGKCSDGMWKCARVAILLAGLFCAATAVSGQSTFDLSSPDGRVQLKIETSTSSVI